MKEQKKRSCIICQAMASQIGRSCDSFKLHSVVISSEAQVLSWTIPHPCPMPSHPQNRPFTMIPCFPKTYLLLSHYLVIPCSFVSIHLHCTHCSFLVTLHTLPRYLDSLSCTHYLILDITNASLPLFLCFLSLVTISWLSPALSYSPAWLSL